MKTYKVAISFTQHYLYGSATRETEYKIFFKKKKALKFIDGLREKGFYYEKEYCEVSKIRLIEMKEIRI